MIGTVWKLITFTSMVNRIINTSRNERVTLQVYDICLQMFAVCTLRHTAHIEAIVQFLPYSLSASQVWWSPQPRQLCSSNQVCSWVVVAQTLCPSRNPKRSIHKGLNLGTNVCVFKAVMADWNRSNHFDSRGILRVLRMSKCSSRLEVSAQPFALLTWNQEFCVRVFFT